MIPQIHQLTENIDIPLDLWAQISAIIGWIAFAALMLAPVFQIIKNHRYKCGSAFSTGFIVGGFLEAAFYFYLALYLQYTTAFYVMFLYGILYLAQYGTLEYQKLIYRSNGYKGMETISFEKSKIYGCCIPAYPFVYGALLYVMVLLIQFTNNPVVIIILYPLINSCQFMLEFFHAVVDKVHHRSTLTFVSYVLGHLFQILQVVLVWYIDKFNPLDIVFIVLVHVPCLFVSVSILAMKQGNK